MIRFLFLFFFVFPVWAKKAPKPPPTTDSVVWIKIGTVQGVTGNYTPVVIDGSQIKVYANTNGMIDGNLYLRTGTWSDVSGATLALDVTVARDTYVRTSGIARGSSTAYYAITYTGDGYPTQGGYSPSFATSADGVAWVWRGPITIFGRNQSSASALVVDESILRAWLDLPNCLCEMWSSDNGVTWQSNHLNIWPIPNEIPQFVTAAKDGFGHIHLIGANTFPATALRHVILCYGQYPAKVIEQASDVIDTNIGKGTNLVYDPATNIMHALTSGTHWTWQVTNVGC